jgi:SPP1 gp7 family putative phage head morphogenesis protein
MLACDAIRPRRPPVQRRRIASPTKQQQTLDPIHPSAALQIAYQRKLDRIIDEMNRSLIYWIKAAYRKTPPILAQDDANTATRLRREMDALGKKWLDRFDEAAPELARYFATAAKDRVDGALAKSLRKAGISVRFQFTQAAREVFAATVDENISLIKSIPEQHLTQVRGLVMRSVTAGRDIGGLAAELEHQFDVTKRRAAFIASSQNNIATAAITMTRQRELGITKAIWLHSAGGRKPRPEHVAFNGKEYEVAKGAFLENVWTWPGREPRCRCVSKSIIPALARS